MEQAPVGTLFSKLMAGKWAIEVADEFANANVRGLDLSPMQPMNLPSNCSFSVGDITIDLDEERFATGSIDLVHMRLYRYFWIIDINSERYMQESNITSGTAS